MHLESQHKVVNEAVLITSVSDTFAAADYEILDPILSVGHPIFCPFSPLANVLRLQFFFQMCWNMAKLVLGREQKRVKALGFIPSPLINIPRPEVGVHAKHLSSLLASLRMYTRMLISTVPYVKEEVPEEKTGDDDADGEVGDEA